MCQKLSSTRIKDELKRQKKEIVSNIFDTRYV